MVNDNKVNVLLLCSHDPKLDPRLSWIQDYSPENMGIQIIGLRDRPLKKPLILHKSNNRKIIVGYKQVSHLEKNNYRAILESSLHHLPVISDCLLTLISLLKNSRNVSETLGTKFPPQCLTRFCWYINHVLATTANLVELGLAVQPAQVIIATDLDTLLPGIILKHHFGARLLYDAHEFWPEATPGFSQEETIFWSDMEKSLLTFVDTAFTVSPQLANFMEQLYEKPFLTLPNCEPLQEKISVRATPASESGKIIFLFQGNYAPGRGLEILLENWKYAPDEAILHLRGPENPGYSNKLRNIAKKTGLLKKRIFFLPPVSEKELINFATSAHVGIIPYEPQGHNNMFCCPNKLSQFCAAGLAIFANETLFIKDTIEKEQLGVCFDFRNIELFKVHISRMTHDAKTRVNFAKNASVFYRTGFNWQFQSKIFYKELLNLASQTTITKGNNIKTLEMIHYTLSVYEIMLKFFSRYSWAMSLLRSIKYSLQKSLVKKNLKH